MHDLSHEELCVLHHARELKPAEAAAFESHLGRCPECRELLDAMGRAAQFALRAQASPPRELDERLRKRIESHAPATKRGLALAFVLAVLVTTLYFGERRNLDADGLHWKNGLDRDLARADADLERLSKSVLTSTGPLGLDAEIQGLQKRATELERQVRKSERL